MLVFAHNSQLLHQLLQSPAIDVTTHAFQNDVTTHAFLNDVTTHAFLNDVTTHAFLNDIRTHAFLNDVNGGKLKKLAVVG